MVRPALDLSTVLVGMSTGVSSPPGGPFSYNTQYSRLDTKRPEGVSNPIRPNHTRCPSPYSGTYMKAKVGTGSWAQSRRGYVESTARYQCCGPWNMPGANSITDPSAQGVLGNARIYALASHMDGSTQYNAAILQANGTLGSIRKASTTFVNGVDNLMRGPRGLLKRFGAMKNWREIPGDYLEYCYSWAPLADDVRNQVDRLVDLLDDGYSYDLLLKKKLKKIESNYTGDGQYHLAVASDYLGTLFLDHWYGRREIRAKVCYLYSVPKRFSDYRPVPMAPFSTAWELLPYSFVLDWFAPIGPWVQAMEMAQYTPFFKEGSETIGSRVKYGPQSGTAKYPPGSDFSCRYHADCSAELFEWKRTVLSTAPHVVMTRPALNPFPTATKAAQGLSLLSQAFTRWFKGKSLRD